jgi:hypothetical protein
LLVCWCCTLQDVYFWGMRYDLSWLLIVEEALELCECGERMDDSILLSAIRKEGCQEG